MWHIQKAQLVTEKQPKQSMNDNDHNLRPRGNMATQKPPVFKMRENSLFPKFHF